MWHAIERLICNPLTREPNKQWEFGLVPAELPNVVMF
jgi:hypothetical protein